MREMFIEHEEIDMELTEADNSSVLLKQIEELKSKLAEKDLEIEALKSKWDAKEGKELSCHVMSSDDKCKHNTGLFPTMYHDTFIINLWFF